ncbi:hypothetical protein [Romboutsia ilealis]|uniref:hypothetical protein n=1 Tax=Romboutsia ilealis TaxID=1115758 RepID=UPI0025B74FA4|nr:hypothetical protein [Romboutsia ilealis]
MLRPRSGSSNGRSRWRHEVFRQHVAQAKRIFYIEGNDYIKFLYITSQYNQYQ